MDTIKAAARLSAALGRKIRPEDVEHVTASYVILHPRDGERQVFELFGGNACYAGGTGVWWKNGQVWEKAHEERNVPRPLNLE